LLAILLAAISPDLTDDLTTTTLSSAVFADLVKAALGSLILDKELALNLCVSWKVANAIPLSP
jgi:hypothetical protein